MNIYLLEQDEVAGWDTYDSAVVTAENEEAARCQHPNGFSVNDWESMTWARDPKNVKVTLLGTSNGTEERVICASFNAG